MDRWEGFLKEFNDIKGRLNISPAHIYLTLKLASSRYGVSRYILIKELKISEASARTLLKKIRSLNVLTPLRGGHVLTEKGEEIFKELSAKIKEYSNIESVKNIAPCIHMVVIKGYNKLPNVVIIRDMIIRYGGLIGMVLYKTEKNIIFPDSGEKLRKYYPDFDTYLNKTVELEIGDLVIIAGGNTCLDARLSALNTAFNILRIENN